MKYLLMIFLFIPVFVAAQDFDIKYPGVAARSLGGAYTALAEDATAAFWNPAGLALKKNYEFYCFGIYENYNISSSSISSEDFDKAAYASSHWNDCYLGFKFPIPIKLRNINLIGAISVHEVIDFYHSYKSEEFSEVQDGGIRAYSVSVAYPYNDYLRFGVSYAYLSGSRELEFKNLSGGLWGENEIEKYAYHGLYFINFGLLYDLRPFSFGFSIKPGFSFTEKADNYQATIKMPRALGFGIAYNPEGKLSYSADFDWRELKNLYRKFDKPFDHFRKGDEEQLGFKNAYQVRLGSEYNFEYKRLLIALRIGIGFDRKTYIDLNDNQIWGKFLTAGIGLVVGSITLDGGIEFNKTPYRIPNQGNYDEQFCLYMISIKFNKASF